MYLADRRGEIERASLNCILATKTFWSEHLQEFAIPLDILQNLTKVAKKSSPTICYSHLPKPSSARAVLRAADSFAKSRARHSVFLRAFLGSGRRPHWMFAAPSRQELWVRVLRRQELPAAEIRVQEHHLLDPRSAGQPAAVPKHHLVRDVGSRTGRAPQLLDPLPSLSVSSIRAPSGAGPAARRSSPRPSWARSRRRRRRGAGARARGGSPRTRPPRRGPPGRREYDGLPLWRRRREYPVSTLRRSLPASRSRRGWKASRRLLLGPFFVVW